MPPSASRLPSVGRSTQKQEKKRKRKLKLTVNVIILVDTLLIGPIVVFSFSKTANEFGFSCS